MQQVISNASDPKQAFAVADLALMIKDLPDAEAAYRKASAMPGGQERVHSRSGSGGQSQRFIASRFDHGLQIWLAAISLASAVDKYHSAIFGNPKSGRHSCRSG